MNEQNLIPNSERTPKQRREQARKAGKASGEARRRAKGMREWVKIFGEAEQVVTLPDGTQASTSMLGAVVLGQIRAAQKGNTKAASLLADLLGERAVNLNIGEADDNRPEINIE